MMTIKLNSSEWAALARKRIDSLAAQGTVNVLVSKMNGISRTNWKIILA
jgi:hypothetical protein